MSNIAFDEYFANGTYWFREVGTCHVYPKTRETRHLVDTIRWGQKILSQPRCVYPNGRVNHDAANEEIVKSVLGLIDHMCIVG